MERALLYDFRHAVRMIRRAPSFSGLVVVTLAVIAVLCAVALVACTAPAVRASRVNPIAALRID